LYYKCFGVEDILHNFSEYSILKVASNKDFYHKRAAYYPPWEPGPYESTSIEELLEYLLRASDYSEVFSSGEELFGFTCSRMSAYEGSV
jgi:hypothetical protein